MPLRKRNYKIAATGPWAPVLMYILTLQSAWAQNGAADPAGRFGVSSGTLVLIVGGAALAAIGGWFMIMWRKREPIPRYRGGKEVESSPYEQVAAELQGIKLRISGGDGRSYLPKVERLVHIFADRAGIIGARTMDRETLTKALSAAPLSPEQIKTLSRILLQCEKARTEESIKLDFDPMDMVKDVQSIVRELEREEAS